MTSQEIHNSIQQFNLGNTPELMASKILDILDAMNRRIDKLESASIRADTTASCLANGIQPD